MLSLIINWFIIYSVYYLVNRIFYDRELSKLYAMIHEGRTNYRKIRSQLKELRKDSEGNADAMNLLNIQEEIEATRFKTEVEKFLLVDCMSPSIKVFLLMFIVVMFFYFPYIRLEMAFYKEKK